MFLFQSSNFKKDEKVDLKLLESGIKEQVDQLNVAFTNARSKGDKDQVLAKASDLRVFLADVIGKYRLSNNDAVKKGSDLCAKIEAKFHLNRE